MLTLSDPLSLGELQEGGLTTTDQLVIRDLRGQTTTVIPGVAQLLQFEVADADHAPQVYQVNVADWNMVAPFVIRDPGCTIQQSRLPE